MMALSTCRFCKDWHGEMVKYGVRHYAHFDCYLKAGKKLEALHPWQIREFPYRVLKDHNLLDRAEELAPTSATRRL